MQVQITEQIHGIVRITFGKHVIIMPCNYKVYISAGFADAVVFLCLAADEQRLIHEAVVKWREIDEHMQIIPHRGCVLLPWYNGYYALSA